METRAHHILIGAFTLVVVAGAMLFALWLAKASLSSEYDYYDIVFSEAVTGLSQGGMVQYNGIRVGDVDQLKLDPQDPSKVLVRIRVHADTPVKVDTRASLGLAGLTGVSFIQLTGGSAASPFLKAASDKQVPRIQADDSALSKLLAGSEDIVSKVNDIITRASELLSGDNVRRISATLDHLDKTTGALADQRGDIRTMIQQLSEASGTLNQTLGQAQQLVQTGNELLDQHGGTLLSNANEAMASLNDAAAQLDSLLENNRAAIHNGANGLRQLGPAIQELRKTLQSVQDLVQHVGNNPTRYLLGGNRPREFTPE